MKGDTLILSQIDVMITEKVNDMAKDDIAQWLNMNKVTQSAADVLTYEGTKLPTSPSEGLVLVVHAIQFGNMSSGIINGSWMQTSLMTRPGLTTAQTTIDADEMIDAHELRTAGVAGGPHEVYPIHTFPKPFIIAHPEIWLYVTSSATTLANVGRARILFTFKKVSTEEFFQALAQYGT